MTQLLLFRTVPSVSAKPKPAPSPRSGQAASAAAPDQLTLIPSEAEQIRRRYRRALKRHLVMSDYDEPAPTLAHAMFRAYRDALGGDRLFL